jgi:ferredoxin
MNINSAKLIYFSPTQTTRKVMEGISQGLQAVNVEHLDVTPPDAEIQQPQGRYEDLAIIGSPVYSGRLPAVAISRFRKLQGNDAPAVIVVVYGNRAYEDALLELRDVALEAGFKPIAAGAFIGEHSYSTNYTPIAVGRPDVEDLGKAKAFGEMIREKMTNIRVLDQLVPHQVPGSFPYKGLRMLSDISPAVQQVLCTRCKRCTSVCPTAAIAVDDPTVTDKSMCIRCCACVKSCPAGAKTMEDPRIRQGAEQLSVNCSLRKEPEMYLFPSSCP